AGHQRAVLDHPPVLVLPGGGRHAQGPQVLHQPAAAHVLRAGLESSDPWNNAGTGHAALCELNYSPMDKNGRVDVTKALGINEQFWTTRQFWSSLVADGTLKDPKSFINP
ncbi:malate:quinone oxidoreductase, partial [Staphylococcus aureus]